VHALSPNGAPYPALRDQPNDLGQQVPLVRLPEAPQGRDKQRGPGGGNFLLPPRNPVSPLQRFEEAGRGAGSQSVALGTARVGSLILSYYSVKYWHIHLSDLLSMLGNVTVSSTVTIPAPTLRPEKCRNELKVLLQRQGLVIIRSQNELSFSQKRTGR
jgi:hypothetical protein